MPRKRQGGWLTIPRKGKLEVGRKEKARHYHQEKGEQKGDPFKLFGKIKGRGGKATKKLSALVRLIALEVTPATSRRTLVGRSRRRQILSPFKEIKSGRGAEPQGEGGSSSQKIMTMPAKPGHIYFTKGRDSPLQLRTQHGKREKWEGKKKRNALKQKKGLHLSFGASPPVQQSTQATIAAKSRGRRGENIMWKAPVEFG